MANYDDELLIVRHFPHDLSDEDKTGFLTYFGATDVKCLPKSFTKSNACVARFPSKLVAKEVMSKLHQANMLGQLLSAEFVRGSDLKINIPSFVKSAPGNEEKSNYAEYYQQFLMRLNSWTNLVDFQRPPPVHLQYSYPAPTLNTLTNIIRSVYTVPKLYTQLLHLMNKMNLPCPFDKEFPIDCELYVTDSLKSQIELSDDESEIEMDGTVERELIPQSSFARKRKLLVKRPKLVKHLVSHNFDTVSTKTSVPTSDVFEAPLKELNTKKIEVKVSTDLLSIKESNEMVTEVVQFEPLEVDGLKTSEEVSLAEEETYKGNVISEEELNSNRISVKDQRILPVFKNYQLGAPSCRLYIKNLAKTVVINELHFIYRRYYEEKEEEQGVM